MCEHFFSRGRKQIIKNMKYQCVVTKKSYILIFNNNFHEYNALM